MICPGTHRQLRQGWGLVGLTAEPFPFHSLHRARAWLQNWEILGVPSSFSMFLEDTGVPGAAQACFRPAKAGRDTALFLTGVSGILNLDSLGHH